MNFSRFSISLLSIFLFLGNISLQGQSKVVESMKSFRHRAGAYLRCLRSKCTTEERKELSKYVLRDGAVTLGTLAAIGLGSYVGIKYGHTEWQKYKDNKLYREYMQQIGQPVGPTYVPSASNLEAAVGGIMLDYRALENNYKQAVQQYNQLKSRYANLQKKPEAKKEVIKQAYKDTQTAYNQILDLKKQLDAQKDKYIEAKKIRERVRPAADIEQGKIFIELAEEEERSGGTNTAADLTDLALLRNLGQESIARGTNAMKQKKGGK
jgi:hypothetical protein